MSCLCKELLIHLFKLRITFLNTCCVVLIGDLYNVENYLFVIDMSRRDRDGSFDLYEERERERERERGEVGERKNTKKKEKKRRRRRRRERESKERNVKSGIEIDARWSEYVRKPF